MQSDSRWLIYSARHSRGSMDPTEKNKPGPRAEPLFAGRSLFFHAEGVVGEVLHRVQGALFRQRGIRFLPPSENVRRPFVGHQEVINGGIGLGIGVEIRLVVTV